MGAGWVESGGGGGCCWVAGCVLWENQATRKWKSVAFKTFLFSFFLDFINFFPF